MNKILKKLKVKKIAFCINSNPATGLQFLVSKSEDGEDMAEVIEAVNNYLEDDLTALELAKAIDKDKFLGAISLLKRYRDSMPDDVQDAIDQLVKFATRSYGYGKYPEKKVDEGEIKKSTPSWDSFRMPGESTPLRIEMADEEEEEISKEDAYGDPMMLELIRINKKLARLEGSDKPDKWGSFEFVGGHLISRKAIDKALGTAEVIKEEPVKKEKPESKQIRGYVHYPEEEPDKWSSWIL